MGTSNINDIKNDVKAKEIIPKKIKHLDHLQVVFFLTIFICVYGYPIFYFLGGINAPTFFKLYNRLLKHKTFSGRKCQNKFTYLNTIQKKSLQELSLIQKSFRDGIFHCDSQLFGRLMYVSFLKSIRLKFRGLFFKRLEEIQHCSFALKLAHQRKTRTSK